MAVSSDELVLQLGPLYEELNRAEKSGGNVAPIINELNQCATLIKLGGEENLRKASNLIALIHNKISLIQEAGISQTTYLYQKTGITLLILTVLGFIILIYGSRIFWTLWYRTKRNWIVES